eukprot:CAMPEP_0114660418 /NCGR_PEP_ID=MMETSP0191-20121206/19972_1 /TAXON_ID=126664 /ORGANISM="Sorites sp." /LENGTH=97 /DNA_ID=CAMNT_0001888909 /DNA_START=616 /DNA_END=909 /DNA_ORIENTATION=+
MVSLVLMSNAVQLATKKYHKDTKDDLFGKFFKPWKALLDGIVSKGGQILCCNTCLVARDMKTDNWDNDPFLMSWANRVKGPDIIDAMDQAGFVLQMT